MAVRSRAPGQGIACTLWRWRRLVGTLALREIRVRYAGSLFGVAWVVLEPLLQFALYLSVFGVFLGIRFADKGIGGYGVFLVSGLVPYLFLQEGVTRALQLARAQSQLLRHTALPPEVLLGGMFLAVGAKYLVGLVLVTLVGLAAGTASLASAGWLVVGCTLLVAGCFGAGLIAYPLGAFAPDATLLVNVGLSALLFLSPVLYPLTSLPPSLQGWALGNPLVGVLECFRGALAGAPVSTQALLPAAAVSAALLGVGALVFRHRAGFIKEVV